MIIYPETDETGRFFQKSDEMPLFSAKNGPPKNFLRFLKETGVPARFCTCEESHFPKRNGHPGGFCGLNREMMSPMKPPLSFEPVWSSTLAWPASLAALRQLFPGRRAGSPAPTTAVASAMPPAASVTRWTNGVQYAAPPEPRVVPPSEPFPPPPPPRGNFRIHCLPLGPAAELSLRVKAECDQHDALGYALVSSFSHDGHAFLIFKRK